MAMIGMLIVLVFLLLIVLTTGIAIGLFVWRDAKRRNMNAAAWTLLAVILPCFIGLAIYLVARYGHSKLHCPGCGESIREAFIVCPHCGAELKLRCPSCQTPVEPDWKICPQCAAPLPVRTPPVEEKKEHGLGWILALCVAIPILLIVLILMLSIPAGGNNGYSTSWTSDTVTNCQNDPAYGQFLAEEPLRSWLEECSLAEAAGETGARMLWQKVYTTRDGKDQQEILCYIYLTSGYGESELYGTGRNESFGRYGLDLTLTAREKEYADAEPVLYFVKMRSEDPLTAPVLTLNGSTDHVTVTELDKTEILPSLFDLAVQTE